MKENQRRLPDKSTQQVDSPEPMVPHITPEIFGVPLSDTPNDEDFAVYLDF